MGVQANACTRGQYASAKVLGGVFDLTDSLLFTAPLAYTLLAWALG